MCYLTCRETGSRQLTGPGESPARNTKAEQQQEKGSREREPEQEEKTEEGGKNKFGKRPALIRDKIRQGADTSAATTTFFPLTGPK